MSTEFLGPPGQLDRFVISMSAAYTGLVNAAITILLLFLFMPARSMGSSLEDFDKAAAAQRFLDLNCILYDRLGRSGCTEQAGAELVSRNYPVSDLEVLLGHRDPRVRSLALMCLFSRNDPKLLPLIFRFIDDDGDSFPAHIPVAMLPAPTAAFSEVPQTPQTVGALAQGMIAFYLKRSNYLYGARESRGCPGFDDYWRQRKDRAYLSGWFLLQLDRATQGTSPIPAGREKAFEALRSDLERIEGKDRLWYSLLVGSSEGGERVFSEEELVKIGKDLGPDPLMLMLAGKEPASDPDLVPKTWSAPCGRGSTAEAMRSFVLRHADNLLRRDDYRALLSMPDAAGAEWSIAAASLRPDLAEEILKTAVGRMDPHVYGWQQALAAVALVRIAGDSQTPYALDWFYGRSPLETRTTAQEVFVTEAAGLPQGTGPTGPTGRPLLARLVADPRFDTLPEAALQTLLSKINAWLPAPLVEDPYQYAGDDEKKALFARWRKAIRESVPRWQ